MLSIVATETSVLTFISVPGIAYRGDWTFLQLSFGYLFGRILVSFYLLPLYFKYGVTSIYEILENRFTKKVQKLASGTFLVTRILADGVRFLATAIIIETLTGWTILTSICIIGCVTLLYTVLGGLKAVIRVDAFQFIIYLLSAFICIYFLLDSLNHTFLETIGIINDFEKGKILNFTGSIFTTPFMFFSAFIGGTMLSFASHGADYMMVQRVLAITNIKSARKAMIGSGIFVIIQFSLFLFIGSLIYLISDCILLEKDREISYVINNILPIGFRGFVIAGVLSAAMSTLSSSINSLASSSLNDWFPKYKSLKSARIVASFWTLLLIVTAFIFNESDNSLIIIGLKIASFTYGSLLSFFILSKFNKKIHEHYIYIGYLSGILTVFYFMKYGIAWTFYISGGLLVNLVVVLLLNFINKNYCKYIISLIILFLSIILLFSNLNKNKSTYSTQIINYEIKKDCLSSSIWYGSDVLRENFEDFSNIMNIGIVVNHTSDLIYIDDDNKTIEINFGQSKIYVKKIFTPEHGLNNNYYAGEKILGDLSYNIPIVSLYGKNLIPHEKDLENLDAIVFDIQDIGSRYYTYISTLTNIMKACAKINLPIYVLDRPNPIGNRIMGPILEMEYASFVGMHPIPITHGMTIGELAYMINELGWLGDNKANLHIVKMQGWDRNMYFENTGKEWIPPSPNIEDNVAAFIYQGTCLIEGTNLSEGRGTQMPFRYIGAPWLNSKLLLSELNKIDLAGVEFKNIIFTPRFIPSKSAYPKYKDEQCRGVEIYITDRAKASPLKITTHIINIVSTLHPEEFKFNSNNFIDNLYGDNQLRKNILLNDDMSSLFRKWNEDEIKFKKIREPFLLY